MLGGRHWGSEITGVTAALRSDPSVDLPRSFPRESTRRTGTRAARGALCAGAHSSTGRREIRSFRDSLGGIHDRAARCAVAPASTDAQDPSSADAERDAAADVTRFTNNDTSTAAKQTASRLLGPFCSKPAAAIRCASSVSTMGPCSGGGRGLASPVIAGRPPLAREPPLELALQRHRAPLQPGAALRNL